MKKQSKEQIIKENVDLRKQIKIFEQQIIEFCGWLRVLNLYEAKKKIQKIIRES